jgi:ATP-dependent Clp protease ATP-binding subunit ClpC
LKDPQAPDRIISSFSVPTGCGKTYLARTLAEFMFGRPPDALIQIDMSEYMEKFTASRLNRFAAGLSRLRGGRATFRAVRRRHTRWCFLTRSKSASRRDAFAFARILEDGKITDSLGRKIDFRNTIIIMTSNVGADLSKKQTVMGFGAPLEGHDYVSMRDKILDETKRVFKPEFLNRLDEIIVFHSLGKPELLRIVDLEVNKVLTRIKAKEVHIDLSQSAKEFLIEKGYDPQYGARPMRRAVERYLEDPLAEELLRGHVKAGDRVEVMGAEGKLTFHVAERATPKALGPAPAAG